MDHVTRRKVAQPKAFGSFEADAGVDGVVEHEERPLARELYEAGRPRGGEIPAGRVLA